ncbi:hypothetical protein GCM10007916_23350 [Psychromonas marina]|uniref:DUF4145 domain-containing protein n=1 Tax=Psychromonas marina TaxID=88364 RepID=A0ABQ6E1M9_9GAMM|nr:hypothetical protein [Psychromonas marina]GLS91266.1 hypothetical protein GCM10007916_23350 [Psychromonas marina]
MGTLDFVASLVNSLAWPVGVVCCIYILKAPAGKLLERVSKLKYGELEAEFQERLNKIETTQVGDENKVVEEDTITSISLTELSEVSPRAAILEAWVSLEKTTSVFCQANGLPAKVSYQGLFKLAKEKDLDIEPFQAAYQELRVLRNKAVHASDLDITATTAKQYVKTANFVAQELSMRSHSA